MTRFFAPFGFDLPALGNRLRDRETSAPGAPPGRENCAKQASPAYTFINVDCFAKNTASRDLSDPAYRFVRHRLNGVTYSATQAASAHARRNKKTPAPKGPNRYIRESFRPAA